MSIRATFHYFQGMECDMYSFYRIPKLLFTSEYFKNLSCEAKVLYGLMLDRMSLSIKNRWFDEEDRAYIFFSVEEIMEMLNCGRNKAVNCLKELDQEKGIGLIEKRRIGLGKTNVIYVKNFSLTEYPDEPAIFDSEETPENVAERKENTETEIEEYAKKEPEKPVNTQKFEKQTSGSLKNKLQEVSKTNFKEFEKQTSRSLENKLQEVSKTNCNNTEYNYTEHHFTTLQMISLSANQPFYGIHQPCRFYSCFDVFDETDVKYLFLNFLADEKTEVLYAFTAVCGKIFFLIRQQFHCAVADIDQVD